MTKYVETSFRNGMVTIDGYTTIKNVNKAMLDVCKAIEKFDQGEADTIREAVEYGDNPIVPNIGSGYCFTMEEVDVASKYDEATDEIITSTGAWYFVIRFAYTR